MGNVIFYGGTGQAKMARSMLPKGYEIDAVIDDFASRSPFSNVPLFKSFEEWKNQEPHWKITPFVITIGNNPLGSIRRQKGLELEKAGLEPLDLIHPTALFEFWSMYGKGCQFHAHSILNPEAEIGDYCILNTRALVEHDCVFGHGVEIGPGAVVCGEVTIGDNTWIGANATIKHRVRIGKNCVIGCGAVVVNDVPDGEVWVGNPARFLRTIG